MQSLQLSKLLLQNCHCPLAPDSILSHFPLGKKKVNNRWKGLKSAWKMNSLQFYKSLGVGGSGGQWGAASSMGSEQHQLHKLPGFMQSENGAHCQQLLTFLRGWQQNIKPGMPRSYTHEASPGLEVPQKWALILAVPFNNCVTLGMFPVYFYFVYKIIMREFTSFP